MIRQLFADIYERKDLIFYLTRSDLKSNTARTYLGFLWWILDPVIYMLAFFLVITIIRGADPSYPPSLFAALIPLKWTISCLVDATSAISGRSSIIQQVYVPKIVFVLVKLTVNTFKFVVGSIVLFLFLWAFPGIPVTELFAYYIFIVPFQLVFNMAGMVVLAHLGVYLKDVKQAMQYGARMLFFLSPVLFTLEEVRARSEYLANMLYMNPMTSILPSYRNILIHGQYPEWIPLLLLGTISLAVLYIGLRIIYRYEKQYAKVI